MCDRIELKKLLSDVGNEQVGTEMHINIIETDTAVAHTFIDIIFATSKSPHNLISVPIAQTNTHAEHGIGADQGSTR